MADGRRIYHKAWCGGGGWGDDVHVCKSARGSREAPGVMCVPLSQSLEADGGDIYHKAGCGRGGAWGFRGVNLCACRCRRAYEADGGAGTGRRTRGMRVRHCPVLVGRCIQRRDARARARLLGSC